MLDDLKAALLVALLGGLLVLAALRWNRFDGIRALGDQGAPSSYEQSPE